MRRFLLLSPILFAAACAPRPQAASVPPPSPQPSAPARQSALFGLNVQQLAEQFGKPALQIHEGNSVKLQFRGPRCVLDAYLYPAPDGQLRVTYVDTRRPTGDDMDQTVCITGFRTAS